jgi:uracil-DNA glycosylase family 4
MPHQQDHTAAWERLNHAIAACDRCPRLRAYCREVAQRKRRAFAQETYWGLPVPNFGDPQAAILIVGLAPAAHGANRTGRMFTGDVSGQFLYRALFAAGLATLPESRNRHDGLALNGCAITAACHCAPPQNRPLPAELAACQTWLSQTIDLLQPRVLLSLGAIAWKAVVLEARRRHWLTGRAPRFSHGARLPLEGDRWLLASYHPSQQNTFTGRLKPAMLDSVLGLAISLARHDATA